MEAEKIEYTAYTDGACRGNPGPGGWGAVLQKRRNGRMIAELELSGGSKYTTNNKMELIAAISALKRLTYSSRVTLYTDSQYVKNGITSWIKNWKRNGWKTKGKTPVKNVDLWKALDAQCLRHEISWGWVRGHSGNKGNERADTLAKNAIPSPPPRARKTGAKNSK